MALITVIHYLGYSSVADNASLLPLNKVIVVGLKTLTVTAVNIFPMITGYLICNKKTDMARPFKLWSEGWFYSFILIFAGLIVADKVSAANLLYSVLPFSTMHYWYLTAVIVLYLLSPLLNLIINSVSGERLLRYLIITGAFITVYYVTNPFIISDVYIGHARGIVWLSFLYLLGGYLRQAKLQSTKAKVLWAFLGIVAFAAIFTIKYFNISASFRNAQLLSDYSVVPFILTLSTFIVFKDIKIKSKNITKLISLIAECSFGVYLIQEHIMIRGFYWSFFDANKYANSSLMILQLLCSIIIIWPFAFIVHFIFKKLFNLLGIKIYNSAMRIIASINTKNAKTK
ncbi:MAG: acyltransferase family protein [Clostridia bacterium]|nr:acyltransferase family protein [Clostridia bacterium]